MTYTHIHMSLGCIADMDAKVCELCFEQFFLIIDPNTLRSAYPPCNSVYILELKYSTCVQKCVKFAIMIFNFNKSWLSLFQINLTGLIMIDSKSVI